jgi:muconolactone delta-isomerase
MYIDYDSDGRVDVEALHQLMSWLPLQKIFTRTVNPTTSQQLYNAFLVDYKNAEFSSSTALAQSGNQLAREIWNAVGSHTDDILRWIEADSSGQESAGSGDADLRDGVRF